MRLYSIRVQQHLGMGAPVVIANVTAQTREVVGATARDIALILNENAEWLPLPRVGKVFLGVTSMTHGAVIPEGATADVAFDDEQLATEFWKLVATPSYYAKNRRSRPNKGWDWRKGWRSQ